MFKCDTPLHNCYLACECIRDCFRVARSGAFFPDGLPDEPVGKVKEEDTYNPDDQDEDVDEDEDEDVPPPSSVVRSARGCSAKKITRRLSGNQEAFDGGIIPHSDFHILRDQWYYYLQQR
jgi:hypothetical protein